MELLWWFNSIRTDFLDTFFSIITYFGHTVLPMIILCIVYWCYNKQLAYRLGLSFLTGALILQFLKITFRIPRPWQIDTKFIPVVSALDGATGYSFPSGHSQASGALYTMLFLYSKNKIFKALMVFLIIAVPISRLYLGVHTLLDVSVGALIGIVFSVLFFYLFEKIDRGLKADIIISVIVAIASIILCIMAYYIMTNIDINPGLYNDCFKMTGIGLAFAVSYPIEKNRIRFNPQTTLLKQIIKTVVGVIIMLGIRYAIKRIFGPFAKYDLIRYFIVGIFMLILYPMTFKYFFKPKEKNENFTE